MKNLVEMDQLINTFSIQLQEAIEIGKAANIQVSDHINNVVVTGLGGSGIGADLTRELVHTKLIVPMESVKGYQLPNYVNNNTLMIVSSYSGNTEETISCFNQGMERGAQIVCISSGGQIIDVAKEKGIEYIIVPGGNPPRACLGYSFVQQLFILNKKGLIHDDFIDSLKTAINFIESNKEEIKLKAQTISEKIFNKFPIIYSEDSHESIAVRMRQQLNENAKMLCMHHVVPEMNHNELVGWREASDKYVAIFLRNDSDHESNQKRIEINKDIIQPYVNEIIEIWSKGTDDTSKRVYMIHLIDWISFYAGVKRKFDTIEVDVIDYLKKELAK